MPATIETEIRVDRRAISQPSPRREVEEAGRRMRADVRRVSGLDASDIAEMFQLFNCFYEGADPSEFRRDLVEKQWVILLRCNQTDDLCGFTTMSVRQITLDGKAMSCLFSGDTIVRPEYWGESTLSRAWIQHALRLRAAADTQDFYWFLISGGYKTYRFLPVFYREFYPRHDQLTPQHWQKRLDGFAFDKFGHRYDARRGIVSLDNPTPLRDGVADIPLQRLSDPHIAFFAHANPGHTAGEELACIVPLNEENLTAAGKRMLRE